MPVSEITVKMRKGEDFHRYRLSCEKILLEKYQAEHKGEEIDSHSKLYLQMGTIHFFVNHGENTGLFLDWEHNQLKGTGKIRIQSSSKSLVRDVVFDMRYYLSNSSPL
ncbi:MAG TPA: hypothetical protein VJJ23_00935 [Candidatus Nanoarchaeia archaeon]|nr:hypothetical protein [Candidatus Nanoarchaeia archaeon]